MPLIIGTDEAGYGPNLGPLVVGASMWQVPEDVDELYEQLSAVICRAGSPRPDDKIAIGDSKALYQSRGRISELERSVLTMLGVVGEIPNDLHELFRQTTGTSSLQLASETTYQWDDIRLPVDCQPDEIQSMSMRLRETLAERQIQCLQVRASVVFPRDFNRGLADFGNKASLLSTITCRLIRNLIESIEPVEGQNVIVLCDKHGGRAHYAGLLQQELTESFVRVIQEDRHESCYRWQEGDRHFETRFLVKGERHLPIALGSMMAKYLRELSMDAWNRFWKQLMPSLQSTAGYPQDARRFKKEIAGAQSRLQVADDTIWRQR